MAETSLERQVQRLEQQLLQQQQRMKLLEDKIGEDKYSDSRSGHRTALHARRFSGTATVLGTFAILALMLIAIALNPMVGLIGGLIMTIIISAALVLARARESREFSAW